jgi:hypothetical protein
MEKRLVVRSGHDNAALLPHQGVGNLVNTTPWEVLYHNVLLIIAPIVELWTLVGVSLDLDPFLSSLQLDSRCSL